MEIAIIGYGRMGHEIERLALQRGHGVRAIIDPAVEGAQFKEITAEALEGVEVAMEFTRPEAAVANIEKVANLSIDMVVGTTGWPDDVKKVKKIVEDAGTCLVYAPNFSVGINLFYEIVKQTSRIFNKLDDYDVFCHEWHHKGKVDSPSGTARKIADAVVSEMSRKESPVFGCLNRRREEGELHVSSTRGGWVPGTHEVVFDSEFDSVELTHRARGRGALAAGALQAAQWMKGKKGFFEFSEILKERLGL